MAEAQLLAAVVVDPVGLVEHEQPRPLAGADLVERRPRPRAVIATISSSSTDASTTWTMRSARRVSSSVAPNASTSWWGSLRMKPTVSVMRYGRPSSRMARVFGSSVWNSRSRTPTVAPVSGVEQRRLARVRVARQRDLRQVAALALGAHDGARALDVAQLAAQRGDPVARQAAVGLELGLARAARPDAALAAAGAETLEVRPQAAHAGEVVLELGELDLELALRALRVPGEDVEDDRGAVDDRDPDLLLEVAALARRQLVVDRDEVRVGRLGLRLDLLELARPEVGVRVRLVAVLDGLADGRDARGAAAARAARRGRRPPGGRRSRRRAASRGRWAGRRRCAMGSLVRVVRVAWAPVQSRSHREARGRRCRSRAWRGPRRPARPLAWVGRQRTARREGEPA